MKIPKFFLALILLIALAGLVMADDTAITRKSPTGTAVSTALKAGTTIKESTSGDVNYLTWPAGGYGVILAVNVTSVTDLTNTSPHFTILAGDNPPAFRADLGDMNISVTGNGTYFIGPLESARFKTDDNTLRFYGTNITGTVSYITVKRW